MKIHKIAQPMPTLNIIDKAKFARIQNHLENAISEADMVSNDNFVRIDGAYRDMKNAQRIIEMAMRE